MIRTIDRHPVSNKVVQKVIDNKGKFLRYQAGLPGVEMIPAGSLIEARAMIGKDKAVSARPTRH